MRHAILLQQAGYIGGYDGSPVRGDPDYYPYNLTNDGYDFLDAARSQTVWNQVKEKAKEFGGSIPLEIAKALALQFVAERLGLKQ